MKKISDFLCTVATVFNSIAVVIMITLMMIVVIGRYFFSFVPPWSEELALFLMTWLGLLSAAVVERDNEHIRISVIDNYYPQWLLRIFNVLRYLLKLLFSGTLAYYGFVLSTTVKGFYASVEIPKRFAFYPGCATGVLMFIFLLARWKRELVDVWTAPMGKASKET